MLILPRTILERLMVDCRARQPDEACGLLLGRQGDVARTISMANVWPNPAERPTRYAIDPLAQLKAERAAMTEGLDLIGFYHSHPRGPAAPSQFDSERAWPGYVYLILGLQAPADANARAWVLDENGRFGEHPVGLRD